MPPCELRGHLQAAAQHWPPVYHGVLSWQPVSQPLSPPLSLVLCSLRKLLILAFLYMPCLLPATAPCSLCMIIVHRAAACLSSHLSSSLYLRWPSFTPEGLSTGGIPLTFLLLPSKSIEVCHNPLDLCVPSVHPCVSACVSAWLLCTAPFLSVIV